MMKTFQIKSNRFRLTHLLRLSVLAAIFMVGFSSVQAAPRAKHVVLIALDGWGAYSVPKAHDIPNIKWLMEHGSWTLHQRATMPTWSAPNWCSMFSGGVPVEHGFWNNTEQPEMKPIYTNKDGYFPTIYSVIREQMPDAITANFAEWSGIKHLIDTLTINKVGLYNQKYQTMVADSACAYIRAMKPTFTAVCIDQMDHVGHHDGHNTPAYYDHLPKVDKLVGNVLQAIRDAGMWDDTVILMTADHGGHGTDHGIFALSDAEIPFIMYGKGVKENFEITDVVVQFDMAATIAEILGLKRPQCWRGVPTYSAFKPVTTGNAKKKRK